MLQKSPAFSFYAKDFLTGTVTMSLAERGAYVTLLAHQWDAGFVPGDAVARARLLGCTLAQAARVWAIVSEKFTACDQGYVNLRLEQERTKQADRRQKLAANGSKGGASTQAKNKQLLKQPLEQNSSLSFPSSSSVRANTSPQPPATAGGVKVTRSDREEAKTIRGSRDCDHTPPCETYTICIEHIAVWVATKRADARKAS